MTESIYNNAGMPSEQGAAPEVPSPTVIYANLSNQSDIERFTGQKVEQGAVLQLGPYVAKCDYDLAIERIAALTLERDTLKAERDEVLRKSSRGVWRCFHCDEVFDTPGGARDHFGAAQGDTPGCLLKVQLGDERGWLMGLRKEQESSEQQLQRALDAEREVETLECRVASLSSDMKTIKPFAKCDSMRDVFNVYDSMEGRALAAEEQVAALKTKVERLSAPVSDEEWFGFAEYDEDENGGIPWAERSNVDELIAARASAPPTPLVFTCPFDGEVWRFHTQEQLDKLWKHLEWHANREQKLASEEQQREKDAGWDDRFIARCGCGRTIAWYSGEYLHISDHSKACPSK